MTLIASYVVNGIPILLGDLLISRDSSGADTPISTPSVHDVNSQIEHPNSLQIIGMCQKVNLVSDRICVLWSGRKIEAQGFIRYLHKHCGSGNLTPEQFDQFIDRYPSNDLRNVNLIIYFADGKSFRMHQFNTPHFYWDECKLSYMQVAGSGQSRFIQVIETLFAGGQIDGEYNLLDEAVGLTLRFTSLAFGNQVLTGFGVNEGWGGGFEIAYPRLGRFEKLSDIMYLFWIAKEKQDGSFEIEHLPRFIKSEYQGLRLKVFVCDWSDNSPGNRLYVVDPLFDVDKTEEVEIPRLGYTWLVNYCQVVTKDGSVTFFDRIDRFGSNCGNERPISIEINKGNYSIKFDAKWLQTMARQIIK